MTTPQVPLTEPNPGPPVDTLPPAATEEELLLLDDIGVTDTKSDMEGTLVP